MPDIYMRLDYEEYKALEEQCRDFDGSETTHTSTEGYYHKAFRLKISNDLLIEFQGPMVMEPKKG